MPLGDVSEKILFATTSSISKFCSTQLAKPIKIPERFYNYERKQYLADNILKFLMNINAEKVLGITSFDLYTHGLNFVFGMAQYNGKVAVVSTYRLNPAYYFQRNENIFRERIIKEVRHEFGHLLGLHHCQNACVMQFSNSIQEVDEKPKEFCEKCRCKLKLKL